MERNKGIYEYFAHGCIELVQEGTPEQRFHAIAQLMRLAQRLDELLLAEHKRQKAMNKPLDTEG